MKVIYIYGVVKYAHIADQKDASKTLDRFELEHQR